MKKIEIASLSMTIMESDAVAPGEFMLIVPAGLFQDKSITSSTNPSPTYMVKATGVSLEKE